jgi:hypothetical protein
MDTASKAIDYTDHGFVHLTLVAVAGVLTALTWAGPALFA